MKKMIYYVPDAEHQGDVDNDCRMLEEHGATVIDTDIIWGDDEIHEARITLNVPDDRVEQFFELGCYEW